MNPEEKHLLETALELAQENNRILREVQRSARWSRVWGFFKFLIIAVPIILGYLYLVPYIDILSNNFNEVKSLIPIIDSVPN